MISFFGNKISWRVDLFSDKMSWFLYPMIICLTSIFCVFYFTHSFTVFILTHLHNNSVNLYIWSQLLSAVEVSSKSYQEMKNCNCILGMNSWKKKKTLEIYTIFSCQKDVPYWPFLSMADWCQKVNLPVHFSPSSYMYFSILSK
jgi:hypothetical protein